VLCEGGVFNAQQVIFTGAGSYALTNTGFATLLESIFDNMRIVNEDGGQFAQISDSTFTGSTSGLSVVTNREGATIANIRNTVFTQLNVADGHAAIANAGVSKNRPLLTRYMDR
jgi:hypothetical protein